MTIFFQLNWLYHCATFKICSIMEQEVCHRHADQALKVQRNALKIHCFTYQNKAELTRISNIHISPSVTDMRNDQTLIFLVIFCHNLLKTLFYMFKQIPYLSHNVNFDELVDSVSFHYKLILSSFEHHGKSFLAFKNQNNIVKVVVNSI